MFLSAISSLGLFQWLNSPIYDGFQRNALNKQRDFQTLIITIPQNNFDQLQFIETLQKLTLLTQKNIYLMDLTPYYSESLPTLANNLYWLESIKVGVDNKPLVPKNLNSSFKVINNIDYQSGSARYYQFHEPHVDDQIFAIFNNNKNKVKTQFGINYMVGDGYLPSISALSVLNDEVLDRLFENKNLLILPATQQSIYTPINVDFATNLNQYYGFLFETALSNKQIHPISDSLLLLLVLATILILSLLLQYLSKHIRSLVIITWIIVCSFISWLILSFFGYYLPVVELIITAILTNYLISLSRSQKLEQRLVVSNRFYSQVLEEYASKHERTGYMQLLHEFANFVSELIPLTELKIYLQENSSDDELIYEFNEGLMLDNTHDFKRSNGDRYQSTTRFAVSQHKQVKIIARINNSEDKTDFTQLIQGKENYLKHIFDLYHAETSKDSVWKKWLIATMSLTHNRSIDQTFKETSDEFANHYFLLKTNFERLKTASILYNINGEVLQTNQSAQDFAQNYNIRIFNQSVLATLTEISSIDQIKSKEYLLELIHQQINGLVLPVRIDNFDKSYLMTLTQYLDSTNSLGGFLMEIANVDEISFAAKLKNDYVSELNNQLRNDFSEIMLAVDFMEMGAEDAPNLETLSELIEKMGDKLKNSDIMLQTINDIMRNKYYPVDIRELLEKSLEKIKESIEEAQLELEFKKPHFMSLVLVDYGLFIKLCHSILEMAVKDSISESKLLIELREIELEEKRWAEIYIQTSGYGILSQEIIRNKDSNPNQGYAYELTQIKQQMESMGGEMSVDSIIGEGSAIKISLPCNQY